MYYTQTTGSAISDVTFQPAHNDSTASCEVERHVQMSSITVTERAETDMPLAVHTERGAWCYCPQNTGGSRPVSIETGQAVRNWHVALSAATDNQQGGGVVDLSTEIEMEYSTIKYFFLLLSFFFFFFLNKTWVAQKSTNKQSEIRKLCLCKRIIV